MVDSLVGDHLARRRSRVQPDIKCSLLAHDFEQIPPAPSSLGLNRSTLCSQPDEGRLRRALTGLAEAIARDGGRRRARPYLDSQLRRLRAAAPRRLLP